MEYAKKNPTPSRDLELLVYAVDAAKVDDFIEYYETTITEYLLKKGVKDVVVYEIDHGSYVEFLFATSPVVPPWWGAEELKDLSKYVNKEYGYKAELRRDLQIHAPEGDGRHHHHEY